MNNRWQYIYSLPVFLVVVCTVKKVSGILAGDGKIDNLFYRVGSNQDSFEKLLKIDIRNGLANIPSPAKKYTKKK